MARRRFSLLTSMGPELVVGIKAATKQYTASGVESFWFSKGGYMRAILLFSDSLSTVTRQIPHRIHTETTDKIVLISNYTQTLDLFEKLLRSKKFAAFFLP